jgi:hypothetical protein
MGEASEVFAHHHIHCRLQLDLHRG